MRRWHHDDPVRDGEPIASQPEIDAGTANDSMSPAQPAASLPSSASVPPLPPLAPTRSAARARLAAVRPAAYARTRNALNGAVTGLSPYLTHGLLTLPEVLAEVTSRQPLDVQHKLVYELGWRAFFRHVWQHRGDGIFQSLHEGPLPDSAYARALPEDIRQGRTGVPVIDRAVATLYATGTLHNHARMWLASYVVHLRKVHWRAGADWLYAHLLDGDLASNHLSWQWVAGTGSSKPYLFNAGNVARFAPPDWHSSGTVVDTDYAALDDWARTASAIATPARGLDRVPVRSPESAGEDEGHAGSEPILLDRPSACDERMRPDAAAVAGRDVWLIHPWSLGDPPSDLPADVLLIGVHEREFHQRWPWSERRWQFVDTRMAELTSVRWWGEAETLQRALVEARSVQGWADPHLSPGMRSVGAWRPAPELFPAVDRRCDSFSQWWKRAVRGVGDAAELLRPPEDPPC